MAAAGVQEDYSDPPSPVPQSGHQIEESYLLPDPLHSRNPSSSSSSSPPSMSARVPRTKPTSTPPSTTFVSSPLNPTPTSPTSPNHVTNYSSTRSRPGSRASLLDIANRDSTVPPSRPPSSFPVSPTGLGLNTTGSSRGSMILYRLASPGDDPRMSDSRPHSRDSANLLLPPKFPANRDSTLSSSGSSFISLDSKYPTPTSHRDSAFPTAPRGLVPYEYDPALDELDPIDAEDLLHDPASKGLRTNRFPWRGIMNVSVMLALILALLCLFIFYPVITFYRNAARLGRIDGNIRINATGQAPVLFQMPDLIDTETPQDARTRTGFDGKDYDLVFSDEFNTPGRTFFPGDDPYWEAVDLWYGATADLEWYDPQQVTTRDGHLVITMDSADTLVGGVTPGSTAPFTTAENHGLTYRSGMLQSWNKFCFSSGYIEVAVVLPGPNEDTKGYWPGVWTMGNLARPGYPATTDGMWPYTYDSCDVGTFPNQTLKDRSGPEAALHSDKSRSTYNFELSWLSGQRLSACSCPGSDHPGPRVDKGRGAPEIDIFEAEKDKENPHGHVVSQSAQFAPFTHDYLYNNATADQHEIFDTDMTRPNSYHGSAVQQSVSSVSKLPSDMFQGTGQRFVKLGFEYWANPSNIDEGYILWQVDGKQSHRLGSGAVSPDQGSDGSGVGQRLIPEEPMSIVLNLGMSQNWQTIDLTTMQFPAEFSIDYVRVYQRKGSTNIGCSPKDYPTEDYINNHKDAYQNVNTTTWNWEKPKNRLYDGC